MENSNHLCNCFCCFFCKRLRPAPRPRPHPSQSPSGIQAQLTVHTGMNLADNDVVIFDNIIYKSDRTIKYNIDTGIFTLFARGLYLINWNISICGTGQKPFVRFGISRNGQIQGASTHPAAIGELHGSNLITVTNRPADIALANDTDDFVQLSKISPIANITIVQIK